MRGICLFREGREGGKEDEDGLVCRINWEGGREGESLDCYIEKGGGA